MNETKKACGIAVRTLTADLDNAVHREAILELLDAYAKDLPGHMGSLPDDVKRNLVRGLKNHPTTHVILAESDGGFVGLAVCFLGFSTFAAKPVLNIHDLAVLSEYRGMGIGRALLDEIEKTARNLGCCRISLEVRETNTGAIRLYEKAGFENPPGGSGKRFFYLSKELAAGHGELQ